MSGNLKPDHWFKVAHLKSRFEMAVAGRLKLGTYHPVASYNHKWKLSDLLKLGSRRCHSAGSDSGTCNLKISTLPLLHW